MIKVDEALEKLFGLCQVVGTETVDLINANGRVLTETQFAKRDQPPFDSSAMDGYAVIDGSLTYDVIGESAAGHGFHKAIGPGQAVRIFTGAPVPQGANRVIIQEDVTRSSDKIMLNSDLDPARYIRAKGADFQIGAEVSPGLLGPTDLALLAAMNVSKVEVRRKPRVALIATGDELVMPGENPNTDQIIASNTFALAGMLTNAGATPQVLPIARDTKASLNTAFELAQDADLIVTIGGASVGDHDLVAAVAAECGLEQSFYKIAMRPGKPLMAGKMHRSAMLGLPGNPVSSIVCGVVFMIPMVHAMLGLGTKSRQRFNAILTQDIGENGLREHYMRAIRTDDGIKPLDRQDSSLLSVLSQANALLVRPIGDPARHVGESVEYIEI